MSELIAQIGAIGEEATHLDVLPPPKGGRQPRLAGEVRDRLALAEEHRIGQQNDPFDARFGRDCESGLQVGWDGNLDQVEREPYRAGGALRFPQRPWHRLDEDFKKLAAEVA